MNVKRVGEFIKQKRKEKKLTQKELAEKLSITDRAISKWERGICCPDISILKELSSILEVSVNELLAGEEIEKLEKEKTDDVLVDSVKQYTSIEKKKNKKLLIFTIILLLFYIGLIFVMYLTFNQVNKTNGLNWEIIQTKRVAEKFYTAIEDYDYETIREMIIDSYGYNTAIRADLLEDETKCDEYRNEDGNYVPARICRLKFFEDEGIKFISHKFEESFYVDGYGEFATVYKIELIYNEQKFEIHNTISTHNGVITYMGIGWEDASFSKIKVLYPNVLNKLEAFFGTSEWEE